MNDETKARLAALPKDAPDAAVIAVWAGHEAEIRPHWGENSDNIGWHSREPNGGWHWLPAADVHGERTLRRWLLDGGVVTMEYLNANNKYTQSIDAITGHDEIVAEGDSPEMAFTDAVKAFSKFLRHESDKIEGATGKGDSTTQKETTPDESSS